MKINASVTILTGENGTEIEIRDNASRVTFARIRMTPEQFCAALGRLADVESEYAEVVNLESVGKFLEVQKHEFEINTTDWSKRKEIAKQIGAETCPPGWICDNYYGSQDSFFEQGGKQYARVTIRRWVEKPGD
jgi:hypothetical protein